MALVKYCGKKFHFSKDIRLQIYEGFKKDTDSFAGQKIQFNISN